MDNIYKAVQLTIDSQNLALSKTPSHVYIANQYVDTNDTPLITAPFIIQKALENGAGVVDIVSSTIGSIYEVRLLCDAEVLISGYFYMPPMNVNFSELELYTSYPPRTPPVVNEFWQKTENFILEKTNTLLNFVQVFNSLSSMRLSLGYLEELATTKKSNLVSAINEVFNSLSSMRLSLGYLEELATTKKSNLVSAINEVYKRYEGVGDLYEKNVEAGAGANGWTTDLVAENGLTQKQINNFFKSKKLVDTRLYGVVANTEADQTAAIHAAFAANPNSNNFYIPTGVIKANIVYPRSFINLVGDSMLKTVLQPFDLTKPAVSFNKFLYPALTQLSVQAGQAYTSEQLVDARDSRYIYMREVHVAKTINSGETHSYQTILIDNRSPTVGWTGYNTFDNVRCTYGSYGYLSDTDKLNSVISMKSCVFATNGYFGIKTNSEQGSFLSMDIAGNGKLCPSGTYDETMYGGVYLRGANTVILAAWHEYNQQSTNNFSENNLYIEPGSSNIAHNFSRNTRSSVNTRVFTQSQGQLINVSTADRATDDGLGRARPQQLIKNGLFKYFDAITTKPKGWNGVFNGTWSQETSDLPLGYVTGFKLISNAAGISNLYQTVYDSANISGSLIKDISKWAGREITISFWLKNIGTSTASIRGGVSTDANNYFGAGNYFSSTAVGQWQKFIAGYKVVGNETKIAVGLRVVGVSEGFITTGFSLADDCRVLDSQAKPITEDGGEVYGNLEINGTLTQAGQQLVAIPTQIGTNGLQTATTAINTTGKYIGKIAYNLTDNKMYYALGSTATSPWKSFDSTNTITPV